MFQYLKRGYEENGDCLFTRSQMEKIRGNGHKILIRHKRNVFTMRKMNHWNNSSREVVAHPALDNFMIWLNRVPCHAFAKKDWTR